MKVLVAGSTGLVGTALSRALARDGHTVCRLIRPESAAKGRAPVAEVPGERNKLNVAWNPVTGELGEGAAGADAVVNLAGASIASGRWSENRKAVLRSSRLETTRALVTALAKMTAAPKVMVSASAIGYYGDRGEEELTEESASGTDFLAGLCREWETEALKAEAMGIRVVLARIGIVLAREGGALPKMMLPFRFFAGGKTGSGKQWMSWIALDDVVGILRYAVENRAIRGPVNVVAPQPLRNAEFTKILARAMHRPALFPAPAFALRVALGEMASALLLSSQRVMPSRLKQLGYKFSHPELSDAISAVLKADGSR